MTQIFLSSSCNAILDYRHKDRPDPPVKGRKLLGFKLNILGFYFTSYNLLLRRWGHGKAHGCFCPTRSRLNRVERLASAAWPEGMRMQFFRSRLLRAEVGVFARSARPPPLRISSHDVRDKVTAVVGVIPLQSSDRRRENQSVYLIPDISFSPFSKRLRRKKSYSGKKKYESLVNVAAAYFKTEKDKMARNNEILEDIKSALWKKNGISNMKTNTFLWILRYDFLAFFYIKCYI